MGLLLGALHGVAASAAGEPPPATGATRAPTPGQPIPAATAAVRPPVAMSSATAKAAVAAAPASAPEIEIGIAYGTEKRHWLEGAAKEFAATPDGQRIRVNLIPMGSLEGARAILDGDQRIHVWSPASGLYRESFVRDWSARHRGNPILKEEALALTPMVIVMWKSRYDAFLSKAPRVSLRMIYYAMRAKSGWARIANQPDWGLFKFGHTHPNQSNSGLMTLVVIAYDYCGKSAGLSVRDVTAPAFSDYLVGFERGVTGLSNSTGNMMKEMVAKGPACYDALMVYESVVIDYLKQAESNWGPLQVVYPKCNLWNDNPYCILNTPWTTAEHQQAAERFLQFLMSLPIQERALEHGFRPGNAAVPIRGPNSPFERFAAAGLRVELPEVCEVPSAEVLDNLQQLWLRNAVPR